MAVRILLRRDTKTNWKTYNPILSNGELGIESDTNKIKIGNGTDEYNKLKYFETDVSDINSQVDTILKTLETKMDKTDVYTKSEIDEMIGDIETAIREL